MELSLDVKNELVVESRGTQLTQFRPEDVAYVINDELFEGLQIRRTSGWWRDRKKVRSLIEGFKRGYTVSQACIKARISPEQYKYFVENHPSFYTIKSICAENFTMKIRDGIDYHLERSTPSVIMWAAERKLKEEYGKQVAEGPTLPGGVINNFGTIIHAPAQITDPSVIADVLEYESRNPKQ